ncbi:MAG: hypothetical protein ACYDCL_07950 [Myxococcales bacterium]
MRSLRLHTTLAAASLALLGVSCGPGAPPVTWTVTPSATAAVNDGNTPTTVTATIQVGGSPVPDATVVNFTLTSSSAASFAAINATGSNSGTVSQAVTGSTANGQVTVQVFDLAVETVTVTLNATVSFTTTSVPVTGSTTVHFGGSCADSQVVPPVSSTSNGSGVAQHIKVSCDWPVMGGSFDYQQNHPFENNTLGCTASVSDANGNAITNAAVQFLTEAGAVETNVQKFGQHPTEVTDDTGKARVSLRVTTPYPLDVPWEATLPDGTVADGYFDAPGTIWCPVGQTSGCNTQQRSWTDSTGHQYNPRDGWVTLIAATPGILPSGVQIPEPYVDENDNLVRDASDPTEPYLDVNCNGKFDLQQTPDSNGFVRIWSSTVIVWTDEAYGSGADSTDIDPAAVAAGVITQELPAADNPPGCSAPSAVLGVGCTANFRFVDKNANLPSDLGQGNQIAFDTNSQSCTISRPSTIPMDLLYSEHPLALTDYGVSFGAGPCTSPTCHNEPYSFGAAGTFNFVDANQNSGFSQSIETITFGVGFSSQCIGP